MTTRNIEQAMNTETMLDAELEVSDQADGCDHFPDHSVAMDPQIKSRTLMRLRRIEGQIRGLQKMVDEERYCAQILTQVSSVHEALRGVAREMMRNHLKHCAREAIRSSPGEAEAMYDELVELFHKHSR